MEPLIIKHRVSNLIALILGLILLFAGLANLLLKQEPLKTIDWIGSLFNIFLGSAAIYDAIKSYISRIDCNGNLLEIKWNSVLNRRETKIESTEIKMIVLSKSFIEIQKQDNHSFIMSFEFWRRRKKNRLYKFFTEFAKQNSLALDIKYDLKS